MKTLKNRPARTGLAGMSVALMLALSACGGGQATSESSASATNAPVASSSASASSTSTSTSTAKASASASVSVVAEPKGSEVVEVRAADDMNADSAIAKEAAIAAAKRVALNENRMFNAWAHGDMDHTSDEELLKFVDSGTMDQVKKTIDALHTDFKNNGGVFTGDVTIRNVEVSDILTYDYPDGTSHPYSYLKVKYCSDWTQLRIPNGERAVTGPDSVTTDEVLVLRLQDGRYVYGGARELNTGCAS